MRSNVSCTINVLFIVQPVRLSSINWIKAWGGNLTKRLSLSSKTLNALRRFSGALPIAS